VIYDKLASVYNDATHEPLKQFQRDDDIYITSGVQEDVPATFDKLSALAFCHQTMNFIIKHYREAVQKSALSGNHKPFFAYCLNRPYLQRYTIESLWNTVTGFGEVWHAQSCPRVS
jgi:hypothetical protein